MPTNMPNPILKYIIYFTVCSIVSFILGLTTWRIEPLISSISACTIIAISTSLIAYSRHYIVKKFKLGKRQYPDKKIYLNCMYNSLDP